MSKFLKKNDTNEDKFLTKEHSAALLVHLTGGVAKLVSDYCELISHIISQK